MEQPVRLGRVCYERYADIAKNFLYEKWEKVNDVSHLMLSVYIINCTDEKEVRNGYFHITTLG